VVRGGCSQTKSSVPVVYRTRTSNMKGPKAVMKNIWGGVGAARTLEGEWNQNLSSMSTQEAKTGTAVQDGGEKESQHGGDDSKVQTK